MYNPAMTSFGSTLIVWATSGDVDANAFELAVECAGGLDCGSDCARCACQWRGGGSDCGAGDRVHQRDHWICAQDRHLSADAGDAGIVLVRDQRADAGTGVGSALARISRERISGCVYRSDCVEPGESAAEGDRDAEKRCPLVTPCRSLALSRAFARLDGLPVRVCQNSPQIAEFARALQDFAAVHADAFSVDVAGAFAHQERSQVRQLFDRAEAVERIA